MGKSYRFSIVTNLYCQIKGVIEKFHRNCYVCKTSDCVVSPIQKIEVLCFMPSCKCIGLFLSEIPFGLFSQTWARVVWAI